MHSGASPHALEISVTPSKPTKAQPGAVLLDWVLLDWVRRILPAGALRVREDPRRLRCKVGACSPWGAARAKWKGSKLTVDGLGEAAQRLHSASLIKEHNSCVWESIGCLSSEFALVQWELEQK